LFRSSLFPEHTSAARTLTQEVVPLFSRAEEERVALDVGQLLTANASFVGRPTYAKQSQPGLHIEPLASVILGSEVTTQPGPTHVLGRLDSDPVTGTDDSIRRRVTFNLNWTQLLCHGTILLSGGFAAVRRTAQLSEPLS
jgi:hypothetical protein